MARRADIFMEPDEVAWETTPDGNRRRVLVYTDELMMVEFAFEAGAEGWLHSHPHVQASFIAEGTFDVTIDGQTRRLGRGGCYIVPSGLQHGVKAIEKGRLIDSFTPLRSDFIGG